MDAWRWLISWLVWLATDPAAIKAETPRAAAAVAVAYASLAQPPEPEPAPPPKPVGPVTKPQPSCPTGTCPIPR